MLRRKQPQSTHLYTWVERGTARVKCLAQEHNILSPGLKLRSLYLEKNAITMRTPRLPQSSGCVTQKG